MREVHFCATCDFRLPYCVRTDRRFCGQQCRLWWYRHRGIKRTDFPPGGDRYPAPRKKGLPKTFAQALAALAEARSLVARLEATARPQQTLENQLRNHLMEVTHALTETRSQSRQALDALRDELETEKKRSLESAEREQAAAAQSQQLREQTVGVNERLQQAEGDAAAYKAVIERHEQDLAKLRKERDQHITQHTREFDDWRSQKAARTAQLDKLQREHAELRQRYTALRDGMGRAVHEQRTQLEKAQREADELRNGQARESERAAVELRAMTTQRDELATQRDTLNRQNAELSRRRDEVASQLEAAEHTLLQRDGELQKQRQNFAAVERAHEEVHVVAASESRSLRVEKERRIAAEQRIEQLTRDLERMAKQTQSPSGILPDGPLLKMRDELLAAELKEVRQHRDDAIAERELLAARILKLMAPGQYLEHAAAAGYDLTKDPLIRLKREEVLVENRLAAWQESNQRRRRARRFDPEQTLDEQAYAAALSFRWKQIDHPHLRRKQQPRWIAVGFLLDTESERYLLTLTEERIAEMKRKMEQAA